MSSKLKSCFSRSDFSRWNKRFWAIQHVSTSNWNLHKVIPLHSWRPNLVLKCQEGCQCAAPKTNLLEHPKNQSSGNAKLPRPFIRSYLPKHNKHGLLTGVLARVPVKLLDIHGYPASGPHHLHPSHPTKRKAYETARGKRLAK